MIYSLEDALRITLELEEDMGNQADAVSALLSQHQEALCDETLDFCIIAHINNDVLQFCVNNQEDPTFQVEMIHYHVRDTVNEIYEFDIIRIFETTDIRPWQERYISYEQVQSLARWFVTDYTPETLYSYLASQGLGYFIFQLEELTDNNNESE